MANYIDITVGLKPYLLSRDSCLLEESRALKTTDSTGIHTAALSPKPHLYRQVPCASFLVPVQVISKSRNKKAL
jgi:hypothetical protein